jgi:hypothetical protein
MYIQARMSGEFLLNDQPDKIRNADVFVSLEGK